MNKVKLYLIESFEVKDIRNKERIDIYLHRHFPDTTRTSFQKQIALEYVLINSQVVNKAYQLKVGDKIEIFSPFRSKIEWLGNKTIKPDIVYEDECVLVVNKPPGLQVHPATGNYDNTLINGLVAYLDKSKNLPFLVHRLDKFTEGLMVFAKSKTKQENLLNQFKSGEANRNYKALVWGKVPMSGTIDKPIGRDKNISQKFKTYSTKEKEGKRAITHFEIVKHFQFHSLVSCKLDTGRTHQIRVHFEALGFPLVGDFEYGGNQILKGIKESTYLDNMDRLLALFKGQALVADKLAFSHPITGDKMEFKLDLPDCFLQAFKLLETTRILRH